MSVRRIEWSRDAGVVLRFPFDRALNADLRRATLHRARWSHDEHGWCLGFYGDGSPAAGLVEFADRHGFDAPPGVHAFLAEQAALDRSWIARREAERIEQEQWEARPPRALDGIWRAVGPFAFVSGFYCGECDGDAHGLAVPAGPGRWVELCHLTRAGWGPRRITPAELDTLVASLPPPPQGWGIVSWAIPPASVTAPRAEPITAQPARRAERGQRRSGRLRLLHR